MTARDKPVSDSRIPLVSGAVIAVRSRPYLAYLLALLALGVGGYALWLALDDAAARRDDHAKLLRLETQLGEQRRQQQRLRDELTLKGRQLDEQGAALGRLDATLNSDQRRAWLLNEAEHYLRLAQQHLLLTRDVTGALTLLEVADRQLAAFQDSRLLGLRQAIAQDRLALVAAGNVDVPGLYLRLSALSERLAGVQLPPHSDERAQRRGEVVPPPAEPATGGVLEAAWAKLRRLVTIRHYDEPIRPLLNDTERALVREGLRLDLAQAQLGLLRGEPAVYQASLAEARSRLMRYFALLPRPEYEGLLRELTALASVDIRPALPDLTTSVLALEAATAEPARPAPAPGVAP